MLTPQNILNRLRLAKDERVSCLISWPFPEDNLLHTIFLLLLTKYKSSSSYQGFLRWVCPTFQSCLFPCRRYPALCSPSLPLWCWWQTEADLETKKKNSNYFFQFKREVGKKPSYPKPQGHIPAYQSHNVQNWRGKLTVSVLLNITGKPIRRSLTALELSEKLVNSRGCD